MFEMSRRDMDLEHPDITCALETGYPRDIARFPADDMYWCQDDEDQEGGEENA